MRPRIRKKAKRDSSRDLFGEVSEGMQALAEGRHGKRTLRTHSTEVKPDDLAQKPFEEIVEPIARSFDESGMSEEDLDEVITRTRQKVRDDKRRKQVD